MGDGAYLSLPSTFLNNAGENKEKEKPLNISSSEENHTWRFGGHLSGYLPMYTFNASTWILFYIRRIILVCFITHRKLLKFADQLDLS